MSLSQSSMSVDGAVPVPLTLQQQRVWCIENLRPGTAVHHLPSALRVSGRLDEAAFEQAFAALVQRHAALRTVIAVDDDGQPVQRTLSAPPLALFPAQDLSQMPTPEAEAWLERRFAELAGQPFDLMSGPLWRLQWFRTAPGEHLLFFMAHQIVWDSASFDLFCHEMAALYAAAAQLRPLPAPTCAPGEAGFAQWQREWALGAEGLAQRDHWKRTLQGGLAPLELPTDKARPALPSGRAGSAWIDLTRAEADGLRDLARRAGTTSFTLLLALFAAQLQRMSGRQDLLVGTPVHGRSLSGLATAMGGFANTVPLRLRVDPKASLRQLVEDTRDAALSALRHPDLPIDLLPCDASRLPVFQVVFSYQDLRDRPAQWGELQVRPQFVRTSALAEDLALHVAEHDGGLRGSLAYNADVFTAGSMALVAERFAHLVRLALDMPDLAVESATGPSLSEQMRLKAWNATDAAYERSATVAQWLQVWRDQGWGHRPAVTSGSQTLTYAQLHGRAEQLARVLRARGLGCGQRVGVCLDRGTDLLVALLAVLKSGAAWVPLAPSDAADRLTCIAAQAQMGALLTHGTLAQTLPWPREHSLWLDEDQALIEAQPTGALAVDTALDAGAGDPACVIYTSGYTSGYTSASTGQPQGVVLAQGAVVNLLQSLQSKPGLGRDDCLVAVAPLGLGLALPDLLLPLASGARVVLASPGQATDPAQLRTLLQAHQASVMQAPPATWRGLIEAGWQGSPGFKALVGGEALAPGLAQQLLRRCGQVWHLYGHTETTVCATCVRVQLPDAVTIGRPIANTQVYILDAQRRLQPIGVSGEICIGGEGVALGYLHRPELSAERFIDDPFQPGAKLYRTGDPGRWRHDGQLERMGCQGLPAPQDEPPDEL